MKSSSKRKSQGALMPSSKENEALRGRIAAAMEDYDISEADVWSDLDELSTHTILDGLEVDPEGVLVSSDGKFSGTLNVYVTLQYGKDSNEGFSSSDAFRGKFKGHLEGGEPKIDSVTVDTSAFYK